MPERLHGKRDYTVAEAVDVILIRRDQPALSGVLTRRDMDRAAGVLADHLVASQGPTVVHGLAVTNTAGYSHDTTCCKTPLNKLRGPFVLAVDQGRVTCPALKLGEVVTGTRAVSAPVGTTLGAKSAAVAAVHTTGGWSVTGMNHEQDHEHAVRINEWVVLALGDGSGA